jgi:hypothetical protein
MFVKNGAQAVGRDLEGADGAGRISETVAARD